MKHLVKTRQWRLYDFLMSCYHNENTKNKYISKREIAEALSYYYNVDDNSTRYLRVIEKDIRELNKALDHNHLIVSNSKGYKIATEEEFAAYIEKRKRFLKNYYMLTKTMIDKSRLDNQYKITFTEYEKNIVEAFK